MKKSKIKIVIKAALITLGILSLISGAVNPLTYYFGKETTASCDSVAFEPLNNGLYNTEIIYHYFISGSEYHGSTSFKSPMDDSISLKLHQIKYIPFFPESGVFVTGYSIPISSMILAFLGIIALIIGLFVRTLKKEKSEITEPSSCKLLYLCPACEKEIDSDSIFCNYCGRKILKRG